MQPPADPMLPSNSDPLAPKRLILVGATVRSAAQSAQRAGFHVIGIDLFGDTDTRQACENHFDLNTISNLGSLPEAFIGVPFLQVGGLQAPASFLRRLATACPALETKIQETKIQETRIQETKTQGVATRGAVRWDDPDWLRQMAESSGIGFPETHPVPLGDRKGLLSKIGSHNRWLRKKRSSCGGLGVAWADADPTWSDPTSSVGSDWAFPDVESIHRDDDNRGGEFVQAWIAGKTVGATMICDGTTVRTLGVCRSLYTRKYGCPFVYRGSMGPIPMPRHASDAIQRLGEQVLRETNFRGLFNVDLVVDRQGRVWLLEINPRWSGSSELIERQLIDTGQTDSLFRWAVDAIAGRAIWEARNFKSGVIVGGGQDVSYLKRILFSRCDTTFSLERCLQVIGLTESLHDVPPDGTPIRRGDPVCTLITRVDAQEKNPMRKHRVVLRRLNAALDRCDYSPRSSAKE